MQLDFVCSHDILIILGKKKFERSIIMDSAYEETGRGSPREELGRRD